MSLFIKLYDKEILRFLIYSILICWSLTVSLALLLKKDHLVVVRVDEFGTTVLTENRSETINVETENFLNNFIHLYYNYSSQNYDDHIDRSLQYLETNLALSLSDKLSKTSDRVKTHNLYQEAIPLKILKIKEGSYEVYLNITRSEIGNKSQDQYRLIFELSRASRSIENPYGLRIEKIEEIYD